jgi:hypothetical protein
MEQLSLLEQAREREPRLDDPARVELLAAEILRELDIEPPVDLKIVASYQGIARIERAALPCAGCLVTDPSSGQLVVRLRAGDGRRRQRFTGFHEVTHTFMPGYRLVTQWRCNPVTYRNEKVDIEALCDVGAAELLLPSSLVRTDLRAAPFGLATVEHLAERYDASLEATAHRVVDLWPEDVLFVALEVTRKPSERNDARAAPKLRVRYSSARGAWPFVRRHKSVPDGDPLLRALEGEHIDERAELSSISATPVGDLDLSARLCPYVDFRRSSP